MFRISIPMPGNKLNELYNEWANDKDPASLTAFEVFQAGVTSGAVSMRERAVKTAQTTKAKNDLINALGELPDIG